METSIQISASILAANFSKLGTECQVVIDAGVDWIHFDVMDHHFVPNLSIGPIVCHSLRKSGFSAPIDVHLMVDKPEQYIEPFAKAGANLITFHTETTQNPEQCIDLIKQHRMQVGIAFNPDQTVVIESTLLAQLDLILLMSVFPGFGGQQFIPDVLDKIKQTRQLILQSGRDIKLGIDGGIKTNNIREVVQAGADFIIVGSGLFSAMDYRARISELKAKCNLSGQAGCTLL